MSVHSQGWPSLFSKLLLIYTPENIPNFETEYLGQKWQYCTIFNVEFDGQYKLFLNVNISLGKFDQ